MHPGPHPSPRPFPPVPLPMHIWFRTEDREFAPRLKTAENANIQPNPGLILRAEPTVTNILKVVYWDMMWSVKAVLVITNPDVLLVFHNSKQNLGNNLWLCKRWEANCYIAEKNALCRWK